MAYQTGRVPPPPPDSSNSGAYLVNPKLPGGPSDLPIRISSSRPSKSPAGPKYFVRNTVRLLL